MATHHQKSSNMYKILCSGIKKSKYKNKKFLLIIAFLANVIISFGLSFGIGSPGAIQTRTKKLNCDVVSLHKDAQSAIRRAENPGCQEKIKEIACLQNDDLYPRELKSQCDFYDKVDYLGCFQDNSNQRIFNGPRIEFPKYNSPHECVKYCLQRKFALAGVQDGSLCECGNTVPQKSRIDEENCNVDCPGDEERKCGGQLAMNIYKVSLQNILLLIVF